MSVWQKNHHQNQRVECHLGFHHYQRRQPRRDQGRHSSQVGRKPITNFQVSFTEVKRDTYGRVEDPWVSVRITARKSAFFAARRRTRA